jgi:hypothetical protein
VDKILETESLLKLATTGLLSEWNAYLFQEQFDFNQTGNDRVIPYRYSLRLE